MLMLAGSENRNAPASKHLSTPTFGTNWCSDAFPLRKWERSSVCPRARSEFRNNLVFQHALAPNFGAWTVLTTVHVPNFGAWTALRPVSFPNFDAAMRSGARVFPFSIDRTHRDVHQLRLSTKRGPIRVRHVDHRRRSAPRVACVSANDSTLGRHARAVPRCAHLHQQTARKRRSQPTTPRFHTRSSPHVSHCKPHTNNTHYQRTNW